MSVSLWIHSALQFGELAPGESRQGAIRQDLAQAIKTHLFGEAAGEAGSFYDRTLVAFANALSQGFAVPSSRAAAQTLWTSLFPAEQLAAAVASTGASQVPAAVESAFCFCVHGLCAAVALHGVEALARTADDLAEEDDEKDGESDVPGAGDWQADYPQAVGLVADLLRPAAWRWLRDDCADVTAKAEALRLVATVLLDTLLGVLGDWFAVETGETRTRDGRPHTPKFIVVRQPALAQRLSGLLAALPFRFTVQPLRQPVAYRPNQRGPGEDEETDCFRVDLIGYRRTNDFLRRLHVGAANPHYRAPDFLRYVEAVNIQQAVPWRINRDLLHWARCLVAIGGGKAWSREVGSPALVAGLEPMVVMELREWVRENFYRPAGTGPRKTIERPGEFLDSPLAYRVLDELGRDGSDRQPVAFYLPWKADYRGRLYAETPWLTPQGGDLQRALLEFHRGRPLDAEGVRALRRHGANLVRRARLLADLKIEGRQVVTLDERERWVIEHEPVILASAAAPLATSFWREAAGKPMQFLAFCLAYRQWKSDPKVPVHLPVQIDGTCNGLQHIAALTGDAALARAVNVLPRADGLPGDIYSELAMAAAGALGRLRPDRGQAVHRRGLELADAWLAASPQGRTWLNRDTAKKVVMTIPYGASRTAQAGHMLEVIAAAFEQAWQERAPPLPKLDVLVAWKEQTQARRIFVAKCTKNLFKLLRQAAFASADALEGLLARAEWERKRALAAYAALVLVEHLHAVLDADYPAVKAFSDWLRKTAEVCSGLPLLWLSPLGFPVCQDKFRLRGTSATARVGAKTVRLDVRRLDEAVDPGKQRDALLPNLVHSLDATHLALTLLDAQARGVTDLGSIHDCLLCHPNDAAELGRVVRSTFVHLYQPGRLDLPDPLIRWRDWMALLVELKAVPRRGEVLAALTYPGEQAERDLDHDARRGDRDAARALDVLAAIRRRDPPERFLVRLLLEYAVSQPPSGSARLMPSLPCTAALPLGDGALSDYFFS